MWHLITVDGYVEGPYKGKGGVVAAKDEAMSSALDPRRRESAFKTLREGEYEHTVYRGYKGNRWPCFYVVSSDRLKDWPAAWAQYQERMKGPPLPTYGLVNKDGLDVLQVGGLLPNEPGQHDVTHWHALVDAAGIRAYFGEPELARFVSHVLDPGLWGALTDDDRRLLQAALDGSK
jgi:hypothetical protein